MKDEIRKHLHDIIEAGQSIQEFVLEEDYGDYLENEMLRSAVERKFEIIGEALNRIRRDAPGILEDIRNHRDIVSFRNILAHGYDSIDDQIVWGVIEEHLDDLLSDVRGLLAEPRNDPL